MHFKCDVLGKYLPQRNTTNTDEILFNEGSHYSQNLTQTKYRVNEYKLWLTLSHLRLLFGTVSILLKLYITKLNAIIFCSVNFQLQLLAIKISCTSLMEANLCN